MSYDFQSVREVKRSRKASSCDYCREPIAVGEPKVVHGGKFDGCMWQMTYHPECDPVAEDILAEANRGTAYDEGVDPEDAFWEAGTARIRGVVQDAHGQLWRYLPDGSAVVRFNPLRELGEILPGLIGRLLALVPHGSAERKRINRIIWTGDQVAFLLGRGPHFVHWLDRDAHVQLMRTIEGGA